MSGRSIISSSGATRCPARTQAEGLAAGDRVQPGTQPLRVAELAEPLGGHQERVLGGVGRLVAVAQQRPAEVVQPVGVAVVDRGEGAAIAGRRRRHQLGVAAGVLERSDVHSPPTLPPGHGPFDVKSHAGRAALRFADKYHLSATKGADAIDPGDEILDVVDEHDRVIGQASRREVRARRLLHRFAAVLCRDPAGRVYVHRRVDDKDVYPGMYDMFAGGVLGAGETYQEAATRELAEELGVVGPRPRFLFKHRYRGAENPSWSAAFEVTWEGPVRPQASEIAWGAFLADDELLARLQEWPFVPDGLEVYRRYLAEGR